MVLALAAQGRNVALGELVAWRKDGLLPPLASCGAGNGRSYYWREPDIIARTEIAHDALRRHGRVDMAVVTLWLHGFSVAPAQLRRAWLYRAKSRKPPWVRAAAGPIPDVMAFMPGLPGVLLQAMIGMGAAVETEVRPSGAILALLDRALAALGETPRGNPRVAGQIWRAVQALAACLETSALIRESSDAEMLTAQRHLCAAMDFILAFREHEKERDVVEALGPSLFTAILTLLRSGQNTLLEAAMARIATANLKDDDVAPPEPLYAQA